MKKKKNKPQNWCFGVVQKGKKLGHQIGFPTVNLDPNILSPHLERGVYSCEVVIEGKKYLGALFFGPRLILNEKTDVLEIHIIDFKNEIYGKKIKFKLNRFIREPMNFFNTDLLCEQIMQDLALIKMVK